MMIKKMLITSFSLLFIASFGCGENPTSNHTTASTPASTSPNQQGGGIVAGSMEATLDIKDINKTIKFNFNIKNQTEHVVTYHFNTSQTFDYIIKNSEGNVVKQYSKGRMFAQHTSSVNVKQGDTLNYSDTIEGLAKGTYTITIWLTAHDANPQPKVTKTFEVH